MGHRCGKFGVTKEGVLIRIILAVLIVLAVSGCGTMQDNSIYANQGREKKRENTNESSGKTVTYSDKDITVEASYLNPDAVDIYFAYFRDGRYPNPLGETHVVFSLSIENKSTMSLTYDPRLSMLLNDTKEPGMPKDYASLYMDYELVRADNIEVRMDAFKAACFDTSIDIKPGEKRQALLVFARPKGMKKTVSLVLNGVYLDFKPITIPLSFDDRI